MKYVRSIELDIDEKTLRIEISDKEYFIYKDIYMLIENYRKNIECIQIWEEAECPIDFDAEKTTAYDIEMFLYRLM